MTMDSIPDAHLAMSERKEKAPGLLKSVALIIACTLVMIVHTSNISAVGTVIPVIGNELDIPPTRQQWVVSGYPLGSACLLVLCGRLADLYGRRLVFFAGSIWLLAFSLGCGFAKDGLTISVLRGFQGAGAAATIPATLGILANAFPISTGRLRSIAFAIVATGAPVGVFAGVFFSALLTQLTKHTWRSSFFFSTGLTGLYLLIGLFVVDKDEPSTEKDKRVDWLGGALITVGLVLIIFVLGEGEIAPNKWATSYIIACLVLGCAFVGLFLLWQRYLERIKHDPNAQYSKWTPPPLMNLSLWTRGNGRFSVIMVIALMTWCGFVGWNIWATLYYETYIDLKPISTMIRFIPMFITSISLNVAIAFIIHRVPIVWLLAISTFITGCAPILFAVIIPSAPYWAFGLPAAICSIFGADFVFASGSLYVANIVKEDEQGLACGLFQTMTQIGTTIVITVTNIVFNRVLAQQSRKQGVANPPRSAQLKAFQAAQWVNFCFAMIATILAIIFFRRVGIVGMKDDAPEPQPDDQKPTRQSSLTLTQSRDLEKMLDYP
ncbi:efflux transporter [Amanita rubescens]|nr:efflux transporter [Amanita rubescens]